ncbi:MAG: isoprenyl transferase [Candidatus Omnitrophica bacterium]|nr:isoprenyl transferase [Candidatus Omnitrophota bacterium]
MTTPKNIPRHVAIIMDGNGRWAAKRGLPRIAGHRAGVKAVREAVDAARELGIKYITLYTFSTENWKRPRSEISALFRLLEDYLDKESGKLDENNIRLNVIGRMEGLPEQLKAKLLRAMDRTKDNVALVLNLALNYGGRAEIVDAVRAIADEATKGKIQADDIDEERFSRYLYTAGMPDPELVIRTSGEFRISNFLLWQLSYAEIYILKKLWPDFRKEDFKRAISEYQSRERRFGG